MTSTFSVENTGGTAVEIDLAVANCDGFDLVSASSLVLPPGSSEVVSVQFAPASLGAMNCSVIISGDCDGTITLSGTGVDPSAEACVIAPNPLEFGDVTRGASRVLVATITNTGTVPTEGQIGSCDDFGPNSENTYSLEPGEDVDIQIRFSPTSNGFQSCWLELGCDSLLVTGTGIPPTTPGSQYNAKIGFHIQPRAAKNPCDDLPVDPCSQFVTEGEVLVSYDVYVAVAHLDTDVGFRGTDFGLQYDAPLGVFDWTTCSDLEFPSGGWPASGSGNVLTWQHCQQNIAPGFPGEGGREFVGVLYVYAYGSGHIQIGPRPVPIRSPNVASCSGLESHVPLDHWGFAGFGFSHGYNPCFAQPPAPVKLLSLSTQRADEGIEITWQVADDPGLGQALFLRGETEHGDAVSPWLFAENGSYEYLVSDPPVEAVTYWIGANERDGELAWLGSVEVSAANLIQEPLTVMQNRPNPFHGNTALSFTTKNDGYAEITVFDFNGREVAKPFARSVSPGTYEVNWSGKDSKGHLLSSGVYLYRVTSAGRSVTRKMLLVRE